MMIQLAIENETDQAGSGGRTRRQRWIEVSLIAGFWGLIVVLTLGQRALDPRLGDPGVLMPGEALQAFLEYGLWGLLTPGIFWLSRRFSLERVDWPRCLLLHALVALTVAVAISTLSHAAFHTLVLERSQYTFSVTRSLFSLRFLDEFIIYLFVLAAGFARDYFLRYRRRQEEMMQLRTQAARLEAQLAGANLQALRMQLNPHFLFNTLHAVSSLVERDPRGVRRMIARLSDLLRYTLDHTYVQEVPLQQELQFLNGYLEIQRIRFQGKLEVHEEIAPEVMEALVPNLILQPLVENAVKHGVSQVERSGRIELRAWREGERLVLSVRDNGPGLGASSGGPADGAGQGLGLRNTRERLEGLYGTAQHFELAPAEGGGLVARIMLPFHTTADLRTTSIAEAQPA